MEPEPFRLGNGEEAEKLLRISTMEEIEDVTLDIRREIRAGIPEVVLAEGKATAKVVEITSALLEREGRAIISRVSEEQMETLQGHINGDWEALLKLEKEGRLPYY